MINPFKKSNTPSWLKEFNTDKQKAISAPLGPTAVIAGAGTGKTTTLIHRIIYLIEVCGVDPDKILILTFTNKAAQEIQERIDAAGTKFQTTSLCRAGTIHAFCSNALQGVDEEGGYKNRFTVIVPKEKKYKLLWKEALSKILPNHEQDMEEDEFDNFDLKGKPNKKSKKNNLTCKLITQILTHFERIKESKGLDKAELWFNSIIRSFQPKVCLQQCETLLKEFSALKKSHNVVDFDDLLNLFNESLDNEEVRDWWNNRIDVIIVDEFQDINPVQFDIISKLSQHKRNVFVVGDPDQAIYGFRGAEPKIFDEFFEKFQENYQVYKLEENFRSTNQILNYANDLINVNTGLDLKKNLFSNKPDKDLPTRKRFTHHNDEVSWIAKKIKELAKTIPLSEMAIIYRSPNLSYKIQNRLTIDGIDFCVPSDTKFFEHEHVSNAFDLIRLVFSDDSLALEAVINYPKRGIGPSCVDKIKEFQNANNITFFAAVQKYKDIDSLGSRFKKPLSSVVDVLNQLRLLKDNKSLYDVESVDFNLGLLFKKIFAITGIEEAWNKSKEKDEKMKNLFWATCNIINQTLRERKETLESYLKVLALALPQQKEESAGINLLNIHKAKGLEFKVVFIICATTENHPASWAVDDPISLTLDPEEEERRCFYVAVTRAKEYLFITCAFHPLNFEIKWTPYVADHEKFFCTQRPSAKHSFFKKNK